MVLFVQTILETLSLLKRFFIEMKPPTNHSTMNNRPLTQTLRTWTNKTSVRIIFDSDFDEFSVWSFQRHFLKRKNLVTVGATNENDVFGAFLSVEAPRSERRIDDPNLFLFSFESHARCQTPQRFPLKEEWKTKSGYWLMDHERDGFFHVGAGRNGFIWFGNDRSESWCRDLSVVFEGLDDLALCAINDYHSSFHFERFLIVQLTD